MSEDMDPAYAETMAGRMELLRKAFKNFLIAVHQEIGELLANEDAETGDVVAPDLPSRRDPDGVADVPGMVRLRGRCADPSCARGLIHDHAIEFKHDDWERILFAHGSFGSRPEPARTPVPEPNDDSWPDQVNCARGESCPAPGLAQACACACEHYHLRRLGESGTYSYSPAFTRNDLSNSTRYDDFYCTLHGWRSGRLVNQ